MWSYFKSWRWNPEGSLSYARSYAIS
ncbi:MAG: hypothetical protein JWO72_1244, partial [Caulobacteraceae bacterium]|nr:hypothetical protein [Caulobacteraceae bacterium]